VGAGHSKAVRRLFIAKPMPELEMPDLAPPAEQVA